MTQTIFEQFLGALLEDNHKVHFKKKNGTILMTLDSETLHSDGFVAVSGVTLEQIGQLGIESAVSNAFKITPDQGGAGKTRIDGSDELLECAGCGDEVPGTRTVERGKNAGKRSCDECYLNMEDK